MATGRVEFKGWQCQVERATYRKTDRIALFLSNVDSGEPVAVATVNMREIDLATDEVLIKDYTENEGMLALLVEAGVVSAPLREVQLRYVTLYICRCLI